ncbi:MAG: hypothetical protein ACK4SX_11935 [Alcanivoracaceae bacterium]
MKKRLAFAISVATLSAANMALADQGNVLAGRMGLSGGTAIMNTNQDESGRPMTYEGNAATSIPLSDSLSVQLNLDGAMFAEQVQGDEYRPMSRVMMSSHLSYRRADSWLAGVFAGVGRGSSGDQSTDASGIGKVGGVEAMSFLGNATLYAQVYYANFKVDDTEEEVEGIFGSLAGRYFLADDTMVELGLGMGSSARYIDGDDRGDFTSLSLKAKHRIAKNSPLYATLQYRTAKFDATSEGDIGYEQSVLIGIEILMGAGSLKHNDRRGATLDTPILPAQAAAWIPELD